MRATLGASASETRTIPPSLRLVLVAFEVRMWRILDWPRLNLPVPVFLKRLAAPECVFNFGIVFLTGCSCFDNLLSIHEIGGTGGLSQRLGAGCCPHPSPIKACK